MKPCEGPCDRVAIGINYREISPWRVFVGLPFVYAPIVFAPLIFFSGLLVYLHLKIMGAQELKFMSDFVPEWKSHRYNLKSQIVKKRSPGAAFWVRTRIYWIFNCTFYCPLSVALLEWHAYLVKIVENWWCPFTHSRKPSYANAAIDSSFWHDTVDILQLHPEDRDNPIWSRPPGEQPQGGVPNGSVPNGSVPKGSVPNGSVPNGSVPKGSVPKGGGSKGSGSKGGGSKGSGSKGGPE